MVLLLVRTVALFVCAGTLALALKKRPAASRHLLWALAIGGALVLPLAQAVLPLKWAVLPPWSIAPLSQRTSPVAPKKASASAKQMQRDQPILSTEEAPAETAPALSAAQVVQGVYIAGMAGLLLWLALGLLVVRRRVRRAELVRDPAWLTLADECADAVGLRHTPELKMSGEVAMPFAAGLARPAIVLPAYAHQWTATERRAVLLHELAHISRGDLTMNLVSYVVRAVYWVNPLAWVATRRLRVEGEKACDDVVLSAGAKASDYAEHLLQLIKSEGQQMPNVALAMARGSDFEGRLVAILAPDAPRGGPTRRRVVAAAALTAMAVVTLGAVSPSAAVRPTMRNDLAQVQATPQPEQRTSRPSSESVGALVAVLGDANADVRLAAVQALGSLQDPAVIAALAKALREDSDARVRQAAANALGQIDDPRAVPHLIEALRAERQPKVRVEIVEALQELDDPRAVQAILPFLRDPSAEMRRAAVSALHEFEDSSVVPALVALVRDPDVQVRREVAHALDQFDDAVTLDPLLTLARDSDAEVRVAAIEALDSFDDSRVLGPLTAALADPSAEVRARAANALGGIDGLKTAPRALLDALGDSNREVRQHVAEALGSIGDEKAVPGLKRLLADPDPDTRRAVAEALKEIGGVEAMESLMQLLKDADPEIRKTAAEALGKRRGER